MAAKKEVVADKESEKVQVPAVQETKTTEVVAFNQDLLAEDSGMGGENIKADSLVIPFIRIAQKTSEVVDEAKPAKFIKGLKVGDFYNNVTNEVYPNDGGQKGIVVFPVMYRERYTAWDKTKLGKILGDFGSDASVMDNTVKDEKGRHILKDNPNTMIRHAHEFFVVLYDKETGGLESAVLSFGGTEEKKARKLNTILHGQTVTAKDGRRLRAPFWANSFKIVAVPEQNDSGSWMGTKVELDQPLGSFGEDALRIRDVCRNLYEIVSTERATTAPLETEQPEGDIKDVPFK